MSRKTIKVLVVDDSALVRSAITEILQLDRRLEVIGTASNPFLAAAKIREVVPDVITLDIEMPKMDGLTFLKKIMSQHPIPVVVISTLTERGTETALRALEYGATDIITKPRLETKKFIEESRVRICDVVLAAAKAKLTRQSGRRKAVENKQSADAMLSRGSSQSMVRTTDQVVAIGASTGGTQTLKLVLENLPEDAPGMVVVQHMPELFTASFAQRLNSQCKISVKEAQDGDRVLTGQALIAPGNRHLMLKRSGAHYYVQVKDGPLVNRHRPSVDVLFRSVARYAGKNALGIIMTGMGDDGARGLLEMKEAGAKTIAQDEASCVVYGMPKVAVELKAVEKVVPLNQIAQCITRSGK